MNGVLSLVGALALAPALVAGAQPAPDKVPIVAVVGCLAEQPAGTWTLTSATEPAPSVANAPPAGTPMTGPTSGKHSFSLIGVSEFDLPSYKGHTVLVKGLLVKAAPMSRVNVTSVTRVTSSCAPSQK